MTRRTAAPPAPSPAPSTAPRVRRAPARARATAKDPAWTRAIDRVRAYLTAFELDPTPVQHAALEALVEPDDALFIAPTGTGKTLAAMLPLCARLLEAPARDAHPGVKLLYLAPVRALVAQQGGTLEALSRALSHGRDERALSVATRSGDSSAAERARIVSAPPDVLVVTPESLAVMLGTEARAVLSTVREIVLDEVHLLAQGKRGALLAATLETLGWVVSQHGGARPRRVGLSATAHPAEALARWVAGGTRAARVYSVARGPALAIELVAPALDAPYPSAGWTGRAMLPAVARAVAQREGTTLVFVQSRPRAEQWTQALRDVLPPRMPVACFHGSMAADERGLVAIKLARGELRAVVTTSSLEVGVDVPGAEQVLVIAAPNSITQLVQSAGRSQHRPGGVPVARVAPSNAPDLIAALAAARCAARGEIEPVRPREGDLDVALQAVLGLCAAGPIELEDIARTLRRAAPFADVSDDALAEVLHYLSTGGDALAGYTEAHRIADAPGGYTLASAQSRRAYLRGVGTIMDEPSVQVRAQGKAVGHVDGRFAALLDVGDRFALAGATWKVITRSATTLEVARDRDRMGPVARWSGQRPSQSELLTAECERLFGELDAMVPAGDARDAAEARVANAFALVPANARAVVDLVNAQREASAMPTPLRAVIELVRERGRVHVVAHTFAGVMANEVIGRVVAVRVRRESGRGAEVATTDQCVAVTLSLGKNEMPDEVTLREWFSPAGLHADLAETLEGSSLARGSFREVARVAQLTVNQGRPGAATPGLLYDVLRKHSPDHVLLRALDQTLWSSLDGARAMRVLDALQSRRWHVAHLRRASALAIPVFVQSLWRQQLAPEDMESALVAAAHDLYARHGATELP